MPTLITEALGIENKNLVVVVSAYKLKNKLGLIFIPSNNVYSSKGFIITIYCFLNFSFLSDLGYPLIFQQK